MNQRKAKQIRKTALGIMAAKPEDYKDKTIVHYTVTDIKGKAHDIVGRFTGFRKAKRHAAAIYG